MRAGRRSCSVCLAFRFQHRVEDNVKLAFNQLTTFGFPLLDQQLLKITDIQKPNELATGFLIFQSTYIAQINC